MRLSRMGASFPTRLSFLRSLLRDLAAQNARLHRDERAWDADGNGHATYRITLDDRDLTLIAWTSPLDEGQRTDRVIATAWDACFVLFDGVPTDADIATLGHHASVQEAGRYDPRILVVSRANKSVRLFDHVADALAVGQQPDMQRLAATGYLMRTTAVYGNGKFGMADRAPGAKPFRLEMLAVYLIREFTLDLVQHVAKARNATAVPLAASAKRMLGIGNSTGLGMAPFLVSHPVLLNNWILVRETALARVRALADDRQAQAIYGPLRTRDTASGRVECGRCDGAVSYRSVAVGMGRLRQDLAERSTVGRFGAPCSNQAAKACRNSSPPSCWSPTANSSTV